MVKGGGGGARPYAAPPSMIAMDTGPFVLHLESLPSDKLRPLGCKEMKGKMPKQRI